MGGWSKVDMAFWPVSRTSWDQVLGYESSWPPMEWMELAVEPRRIRGWNAVGDWGWNGNSAGDVGDQGDILSTDLRAVVLENMADSRTPRLSSRVAAARQGKAGQGEQMGVRRRGRVGAAE